MKSDNDLISASLEFSASYFTKQKNIFNRLYFDKCLCYNIDIEEVR